MTSAEGSFYFPLFAAVMAATVMVTAGSSSPAIGIDLGTTYSCVAVYRGGGSGSSGHVEIIANDQGNRVMPSYVAYTPAERLVGEAAKNQATMNPNSTIFDAKRLIGRTFDDPTVQKDISLFPFKVEKNRGGHPRISVDYRGERQSVAPEEVSAAVLAKLKTTAEAYLGEPVSRAVVTVPAYFNDAQRQATKDAATIAGLDVLRILNEPTAAALAYGLDGSTSHSSKLSGKRAGTGADDTARNIVVFDLGGGTFDVSVLALEDEVFEVLATNGDTHLGGEDFDERLIGYLLDSFERDHGRALGGAARASPRALFKVRREAERAKRVLSTAHEVRVELDSLVEGVDYHVRVTRAKFEELNADLFRKTLAPLRRALKDAGLTKADVDEVVLVGGSTRIPKVRQLLKDFFGGKEPVAGINPDEAVAHGAAIQAAILAGGDQDRDGALGDVLVLDVTPLSLGIETIGGAMTNVIDRGAVVPARATKTFTTHEDQQPAVTIQVFEGERPLTRDNHLLGRFDLTGLTRAPRGVPQIQVDFEVDIDGILQVRATEKGKGSGGGSLGGNSRSITIKNDGGRLTDAQIEAMRREAEEHSDDDKRIRETLAARHELEGLASVVRRGLEACRAGADGHDADDTASDCAKIDLAGAAAALEDADELIKGDVADAVAGPTVTDFETARRRLEDECQPMLRMGAEMGTTPGAEDYYPEPYEID